MNACPICGNPIPNENNETCSIKCRNTLVSRRSAESRTMEIPAEGIRFHRRVCPECGKIGDRSRNLCGKCARHWGRWSQEHENFLIEHYPNKGSEWCANRLGISVSSVRNKTNKLGLTVTDKRLEAQYKSVSISMTENNPMHDPDVVAKNREYWEAHPVEHEAKIAKLFAGHARIQRDNPTKLELKLFGYLDEFGIDYEPYAIIKPKFIVDVKIGNLIIQADGDYWHGHPRFEPLTERQQAQRKRDKAQDKYLSKCGFSVVRIWECDMSMEAIKNILNEHDVLQSLYSEVYRESKVRS